MAENKAYFNDKLTLKAVKFILEVEGWTTAQKHCQGKTSTKAFSCTMEGLARRTAPSLCDKTQHLLQHLPSPSPPSAPWAKQPDLQLGEKGNAKKPSRRRDV